MAKLRPPTEQQLRIAAQMRVTGVSWAAVASSLKKNPNSVECWMTRTKEIWFQHYHRALRQLTFDVLAEAVMTLRLDLRSDTEPKACRDAAAKLIRFAQTQLNRKGKKNGTNQTKSRSLIASQNVANYVNSLTEEEMDGLILEAGYVRKESPVPVSN